MAPALVVAVVTRIPTMTPAPFAVPSAHRAGKATLLIVCAVVVVATRPELTHSTSISRVVPVTAVLIENEVT